MITAYCDGSYSAKNSIGVATSVLLTDTRYLSMCTKVYEHMENQFEIEVYGILQCLEVAHSLDVKNMTIYCDSRDDVRRANMILDKGIIPLRVKSPHLWEEFRKLSQGINLKISHTPGHNEDMNPQKLCDYISHSLVRKVGH